MTPESLPPQETITLTRSTSVPGAADRFTIPRELGPVRLVREIGRGGMGVVYLGRHQMLDRDVAVKFLLNAVAGPDDPGFAGFLEGARAAARLEHPGLTTIHHADVVDGIPYLVMHYVDGPALSEVLKQTGPLGLSTLFAVLDAVSEAIGELHDRGIIHRDIKPSNVLLSHDGRVVVTDFGLALARPMGQRGPSSARLGGTPAYMAPEMFAGEVSLRSDVYALGVMTFELVTGELPFTGTLEEVREQHLHEPLPLEPLQRRRLDPAMIEVLQRAMHKDVMFRYKTAEYLRKALQGSIATEELLRDGTAELQKLVPRTLDTEPDATTTEATETTPTSTYFDRLSEIADERRVTREPTSEAGRERPVREDRAEASPVPPGYRPAEVGSIAGRPSAEPGRASWPARAATLVADVPCAKCDYNLRGLSADGRCPECGEAVRASLLPDRLLFADSRWVGRIVLGQTLILAATTIFWALLPFGPRTSRGSIEQVMLALSGMAMAGVIVAGVFLCTQRESARSNILRAWATRWTARSLALLWVFSWSAGFVLRWSGGVGYPMLVALRAAAVSGLIVCFFLYLAALASRIPNQRLVKYSKGMTFIVCAFLLLWIARVVLLDESLSNAARIIRVRFSGTISDWLRLPLYVLFLAAWLGMLVMGYWAVLRYRNVLKLVGAVTVPFDTLFGEVPTKAVLGSTENERPGTRSPRTETGDTGDESTDVDEVPSADDTPCIHCGYNLRGLPEGGRCPECGTPRAQSLRGDLLSAADPGWLQRVCRGQALVHAGCVALVVHFLLYNVSVSRGSLATWVLVHTVGASSAIDAGLEAVLSAAVALLLLLGAFTTTTLDPRLSLTEQPIALRRFVRGSIVALVALAGSRYLVPTVVKQLGADAEVAGLFRTVLLYAGGLVFLSALVGICYYLGGLAMRIPDAKLATRTRSKVIRFVVCFGIVCVASVILKHVGAAFAPNPLIGLAEIPIAILALAALVYILSLMNLMSRYRKAFRKALLEARKHAAAVG